jgi:hypothetical protein
VCVCVSTEECWWILAKSPVRLGEDESRASKERHEECRAATGQPLIHLHRNQVTRCEVVSLTLLSPRVDPALSPQ